MLLNYEYIKERIGMWGMRYYIEVTKECENSPGFAPSTYIRKVGEIVQKFKDIDKEPYLMLEQHNMPNYLTIDELKELAKMTASKFIEKKYL